MHHPELSLSSLLRKKIGSLNISKIIFKNIRVWRKKFLSFTIQKYFLSVTIDIDERFEIEMEMDNLNIWENVSQIM